MNPFVKKRLYFYFRNLVIGGGILACFAVLFNGILMPWYVTQKEIVRVPDVMGLTGEEAAAKLTSIGLEPVTAIASYDPKQKPNTVVSQNPESRVEVKTGRRIYLMVTASEPKKVTVPELVTKSEREATILLEKARLKKGGVIYSQSSEYPENVVISQSVSPGREVREGSFVTLVISSGATRDFVTVPELTSQSFNDAQNLLLKSGLVLGTVTYQSTDELLPNTVIDQFPKAGERTGSGKAVNIWVSKKPVPGEMKGTVRD